MRLLESAVMLCNLCANVRIEKGRVGWLSYRAYAKFFQPYMITTALARALLIENDRKPTYRLKMLYFGYIYRAVRFATSLRKINSLQAILYTLHHRSNSFL